MLMAPAHLLDAVRPPRDGVREPVRGAEELHRLLVDLLVHLGHRRHLAPLGVR